MRADNPSEALVVRLVRLGFSQYEGRAYVGLLIRGEQTGYALANATGVPQPKIYETLRRLLDRGAIVQTNDRPARYRAVPPETLLSTFEHDFLQRLQHARDELARLPTAITENLPPPSRRLSTWDEVLAEARATLDRAESKVYLSGRSMDLEALSESVTAALRRGVTFVVIHFGPLPFAVPRGRTIRHASTEGTLYRSHRAHHLAMVGDSMRVVWAFARDGVTWQGLAAADEVLATVVKSYVRHDLMIQRIYADLPEQLTELYGPGLLELSKIASGQGKDEVVEPGTTSERTG
jgi:HTH-type transcriptional regulator, sugar sensing transcriptional regulator